MVVVSMMSVKLATLGCLKIKVFRKKGYDVIVSVHIVTSKVYLCDSNCIGDVVMWPKFGNSSISMKEVIITPILYGFDQKKQFFEGCSWFKFNTLGLALSMTLKFYKIAAKGLKLKVKKF